jgi:glycosyltransferase involved in cell wall biosynthesis
LTLWQRLKEFLLKWWYIFLDWFFGRPPIKKRPKISLLIPFATKSVERRQVFKWLLEYWKYELPDAEIIIGHSKGKPFSKTEALNDAARKATGRVLVIIDADTYIPGSIITNCADKILEELHNHLWFVPYRHLFRLTKKATKKVIESDPRNPHRFPSPPLPEDIADDGMKSTYGHRYGAMIMIFPRQALDVLRCFDERFKGWGGEDIAILRALDTLWGKHKTTNNDVLHLWHPFIGANYKSRVWKGQNIQFNNRLSNAYNRATRNPSQMRILVDAGCKDKKPKKRGKK